MASLTQITVAENRPLCYNKREQDYLDGGIPMENNINNRKSKSVYISLMSVVAAFSVVLMHADVSFWVDLKKPFWPVANIIENVSYFAVPVFFMISGATLIDYRERYSTKEFFAKRFKKTVIPFLAWSVFALLWKYRKVLWAMLLGQPNEGLDWTFYSVTNGILNTKFKDIYWFFIPLFCIYLIIPLFASINKERRIKIFTYIIGISLVINFMIPFIIAVLNRYAKINYGWPFKIYVGFEYLYYVLVGYVLHKKELKLSQRLIIYAIGLTGLLMLIFGCLYESKHNPNGSVMLFKGYYNLPIVMYSTGMFLFLKQVGKRIKSEKSIKTLTFLQSYTFPIYLIHRYFLDVFEENLHLVHMQKDSLIYVISATVLALALSILTTMLLRKIPVLRRIVP